MASSTDFQRELDEIAAGFAADATSKGFMEELAEIEAGFTEELPPEPFRPISDGALDGLVRSPLDRKFRPSIEASPDTVYRSDNPILNAALAIPRALSHGGEQAYQGYLGAEAAITGTPDYEAFRRSKRRTEGLTMAAPEGWAAAEQGVGSMAAIAPAALVSPALGAAAAGGMAGGPAYMEAKAAGKGDMGALGYGVGHGAIEYATERIPLGILFGKGGAGVVNRMLRAAIPEITTEQVATLSQDALEQAYLNPNKPWSEYWAERGKAAWETLKGTAGGMGAAGAIMAGAQAMQPRTAQPVREETDIPVFQPTPNERYKTTSRDIPATASFPERYAGPEGYAGGQPTATQEVKPAVKEEIAVTDDHLMAHRPMRIEGGSATLDDLTPSFGEDIYGKNALQYFGSGDARESKVVRILRSLRGKPDAKVTIYRGVPESVGSINPGDWVTLDRAVAEDYGPNVLSMEVRAKDITSWPDSLLEFGYFPASSETIPAQKEAVSAEQTATGNSFERAQPAPASAEKKASEAAAQPSTKPALETLINNVRTAKKLGLDHELRTAINKTKQAADGQKVQPAYFRNLAKKFEAKGDTGTAAALREIADQNDGRKKRGKAMSEGNEVKTARPVGKIGEKIKGQRGSIGVPPKTPETDFGPRYDELAKKYSIAMAGKVGSEVQTSTETMLLDAHQMFENIRGGTISHATMQERAEQLATETGYSVEGISEILQGETPEGYRPVDVLGAAMAVTRVQATKLREAKSADDFVGSIKDLLGLIMLTRSKPSEAGRLLGHYGWLQRQGGYLGGDPTKQKADSAKAAAKAVTNAARDVLEGKPTALPADKTADKTMYQAAGVSHDAAHYQQEAELNAKEYKEAKKALESARKRRDAAWKMMVKSRQKLAKVGYDKTADVLNKAKEYEAATISEKEVKEAEAALEKARARRDLAYHKMVEARRLLKRAQTLAHSAIASEEAHTGQERIAKDQTKTLSVLVLNDEAITKALGGKRGVERIMAEMDRQGKDLNLNLLVNYMVGMGDAIVAEARTRDPKNVQEYRSHMNRFTNGVMELFQANILTGLFTHTVNVSSNLANMLLEFVFLNPVKGLVGGRKGIHAMKEAYKELGGFRSILADVYALAKYNALSESPSRRLVHILKQTDEDRLALMRGSEGSKWQDSHKKYIPDWLGGKIIRGYGYLPLGVEDAIFKVIPYRFELARQRAMGNHDAVAAAIRYAEDLTLQSPNDLANWVSKQTDRHPVLKGLGVLFARTMTNLIKRGVEITPVVGQIASKNALLGRRGEDAQQAAIARAIVGFALAAAIWPLLDTEDDEDKGEIGITPYAPTNLRKRALWYKAGSQPVALRWGNNIYPLYRLSPAAEFFGMLAGYKQAYEHAKVGKNEEAMQAVGNAFIQAILSKHFLQSIVDAVDIMQDMVGYSRPAEETEDLLIYKAPTPQERIIRHFEKFALSLAIPNIIPQIGDMQDRHKRTTRDIHDDIQRKLPGYREDLPAQLDVGGERVLEPRFHSPYPVNRVPYKEDDVAKWLLGLNRMVEPDPVRLRNLDPVMREELLQRRWDMLGLAYGVSKDMDPQYQRKIADVMLRKWGQLSGVYATADAIRRQQDTSSVSE